jgi:hypothetical protein
MWWCWIKMHVEQRRSRSQPVARRGEKRHRRLRVYPRRSRGTLEDGFVHAKYPGGGGGLDRRENPSVRHSQTSRLFGLSPSVERKSLGEHYRREVESIQR